ncbi:MAG: CsgE family curli-type amyloid fiber assembly protein [Bacteroidota bacterium]
MNRRITHIAPVMVFLLMCLGVEAQVYNTRISAKIDLEPNTEFIEITGSAFNKTEINESLYYILRVITKDSNNSNASTSDKSGRFVLAAGEKSNLAQTTISAQTTDRIVLLLLIYDANKKLLGKDRVVVNGTAEDERMAAKTGDRVFMNTAVKKNEGFMLRGLVIQETKTRPGRDFYSMFYTAYLNNNINGEKIVTIKETLSIANNTKIEVLVDNVKILEFFVRPQNEYLKAYSTEAIRRVNKYFQNLREGKYVINQY